MAVRDVRHVHAAATSSCCWQITKHPCHPTTVCGKSQTGMHRVTASQSLTESLKALQPGPGLHCTHLLPFEGDPVLPVQVAAPKGEHPAEVDHAAV